MPRCPNAETFNTEERIEVTCIGYFGMKGNAEAAYWGFFPSKPAAVAMGCDKVQAFEIKSFVEGIKSHGHTDKYLPYA